MNEKQEKAILEIRRIAKKLNSVSLTRREFEENSHLSASTVENWFGNWTKAVEAAGLVPNDGQYQVGHGGKVIDDHDLLAEIIRLTEQLGKRPSEHELAAHGKFSKKPYRSRWGSWLEALEVAYARFGVPAVVNSQPTAPNSKQFTLAPKQSDKPSQMTTPRSTRANRVRYGEPMDFRGLRHAPVNEQGVVYLFGMVSKELGFLIESVRTAYPDCEGKRCIDEKQQLWEQVLIEFEFRSSNFREHGHNPNDCDVIVCWQHDWQDCPLEVVELRSAIQRLSTG
ncbi:MAG: hypothetical protein JNM70_01740 [Anaerolineae bacterium]|nr:hypothetical protein [Anaerolineae bacterium]